MAPATICRTGLTVQFMADNAVFVSPLFAKSIDFPYLIFVANNAVTDILSLMRLMVEFDSVLKEKNIVSK